MSVCVYGGNSCFCSELVSKQHTVICGCLMWVRLVCACSFPVPQGIDTVHTFKLSTVHCKVQYWITFVLAIDIKQQEQEEFTIHFRQKRPFILFMKRRWEEGKEERGGGVSHPGHPTDGSQLPWFQSSCGWCCWADGRQAAGCLTAADGATQVSKNTQALSLAYMCQIIPVIIFLSTHTHAHTHTQIETRQLHGESWLGFSRLLAFYVAASSPPEYTEQSTVTSALIKKYSVWSQAT